MIIIQIIVIALLFTLVVGVHELGHYLFARWRGMEVEEFCVLGLPVGKKVVLWTTKSGMQVTTHPFFPLGGFVRIKGMEPKSDASETQVAGGFYGRGLGSRALVLFAGPLFSVLFGYVFFLSGYWAFGEVEIKDQPTIGEVTEGGAAAKAGLKAGDQILAIEGQPVSTFWGMRQIVADSAGRELKLSIRRDGAVKELAVTPQPKDEVMVLDAKGKPVMDEDGVPKKATLGLIGISPETYRTPVSFARASTLAAGTTWLIISETGKALVNPRSLKENAGGVISIGAAAGKAAEEGVEYFLRLAALISVSLGLINLLPIPLMDGGQLLVVGVEAMRGGRRLSLRTQEVIGVVGLVIIGLIFISVTMLDIGRLFKN